MSNEIEDLDGEIWKDVLGFEGLYQISNKGRVKILFNKVSNGLYLRNMPSKIKKLTPSKKGYIQTQLTKNKNHKTILIHRLVAIHFLENNCNLPQVNHIDGNKANNYVENLEWCTGKDNIEHATKNGFRKYVVGEQHGQTFLKDEDVFMIKKMYSEGKKCIEICNYFKNINYKHIYCICSGRTWGHIKV